MTRVLSLGVVLLVCFATVFAETYILKSDFIERKAGDLYGYTRGTVYYKYDGACSATNCLGKDDRGNSRLRFEYDVGASSVSNLYKYDEGAMFSMCTSACTGILLTHRADPWHYDSRYYTKTDQDPQTQLYWYNRTTFGTSNVVSMTSETVNPQVTRILMDEGAAGSQQVKKIIFSDGREVTFGTVEFPSSVPDDKFTVDASLNCPKATCPIFADLIFVLDNSGSVDGTEWRQTATFVNNVIDTFTFGEDAANVAVVQFNAPSASCSWGTCSRPSKNCTFYNCSYQSTCSAIYPGRDTATVIAGTKILSNEGTVTSDAVSVKRNMSGSRPYCYGNTCQGYGLHLAYQVIGRSPRRRYGKRPQPIVIAVTDGVDHCPNYTADYAKKLRDDYGALVIEVGVGMSSSCNNYDKNFLKRIASKIGSDDNPAYYDVTDYNAIKALSDKLFKPICDGLNGGCGPDCHGFCGCGTCMCPTCENLNSTCAEITCTADASSSTGCEKKDIPCGEENVCEWYECDGTKTDSEGRCTKVQNDCADLIARNPGTCRQKAECSPSAGGCYLLMNDAFCNTYHQGDQCVEYECTPEDETPLFADTGCRIKLNKTLALEQELQSSGKWDCARAVCDPQVGVSETTTCEYSMFHGEQANPLCYDLVCEKPKGSSRYECAAQAKEHPKNDQCYEYSCDDPNRGWHKSFIWNTTYCEKILQDKYHDPEATKCQYIDCDGECIMEPIDGCGEACLADPDKDEECRAEAAKDSSVKQCIYGACQVKPNGQLDCGFEVIVKDCDAILGAKIEAANLADPTVCRTPMCIDGHCEEVDLPDHPATPVDNICMKWQCVKNNETGEWSWQYTDTLLGLNCKPDSCGFRECIPTGKDAGCRFINDTCTIKSNICYKYHCEVTKYDNGRVYRNCEEDSLLEVTTCTREICVEDGEGGYTKKMVDDYTNCTLSNTYQCLQPNCDYNKTSHTSVCYYTDVPPPGTDPCMLYTCNNDTGDWQIDQKCVDGDLCTEDQCNVFGDCSFPLVTCEELNMDAYPCYYRQCIPDPDNNKYICKRKHIKGAMIDLCGQCIMEKDEVHSRGSSDSVLQDSKFVSVHHSSSSSDVNLVECTNAGPRPLLTEGLAAASIALIILAAVVIGAGIAASGVIGTKTLIKRARGANNQSAHTNPLFQENEAEMSNPAFIEDKEV